MPHCPACPSVLPAGATKCQACGATFLKPSYDLLESRLTPEREAAVRLPKSVPVLLGLLGIGGAAWGLMAVVANSSQFTGGIFGYSVLVVMTAMYLFSAYCGVRALQKKYGWIRLNQVLWFIQIPVFFSPIFSYSFATGGFLTMWLQIYPPAKMGWNAWLGSNFTIALNMAGPVTVGTNLLALGITYYLARAQRIDA